MVSINRLKSKSNNGNHTYHMQQSTLIIVMVLALGNDEFTVGSNKGNINKFVLVMEIHYLDSLYWNSTHINVWWAHWIILCKEKLLEISLKTKKKFYHRRIYFMTRCMNRFGWEQKN
eukprot:14908_1